MKQNKRFLIINGPNLNLLGKREPSIYGHDSLLDIERYTRKMIESYNCELEWFQSNHEGEIVERIQKSLGEDLDALIINPAAYSHTSVAILDALKTFSGKLIEVHLSNTHSREDFRNKKLTASEADIVIEGAGKNGYFLALMSQLIH